MRGFARPLSVSFLALVVALTSVSADEVVFRAGFEKGLDADQSLGSTQATTAGKVNRMPDRFGQSLILGPGEASVAYAADKLDLTRGSLTMWVQPNGWRKGGAAIPLVRAKQANSGLALWWDAKTATMIAAAAVGQAVTAASKPAYDWVEPTWHHLVMTWAPGQVALYVDGQPAQPSAGAALPDSPADQLVLGGALGDGATLTIRGVTVLKDALTPEAVQERYRVAMSGQVEHERPLLTVPQCAQPPTIDGKLDDAAWKTAGGSSGLVEIASGKLSSLGTRVMLTCDDKQVYIALECPYTDKPVANKMERDAGAPWDEDCAEIWLQPEVGFTADYFHLIVNAAGSLYDAKNQDGGWNGTSAWGAQIGDKAWTAEVAVPYASMATMAPTPGTKWQANLCRSIGGSGTANRHTAWAFTNGSGYGVWQLFGTLLFQPQAPVAQLASWTADGAQSQAALRLTNPTAKPARLVASLLAYKAGSAEDTQDASGGPWTIAPGETQVQTLPLTAPFPVDQVKLQVRDLDRGQTVLSQMVRAGSVAPVSSGPVVAATPGAPAPAAPKLTQEMLDAVLADRKQWEHNTIGVTDKIPPPWTPMVTKGQSTSCWARSYDYAGSLFPRQVKSLGQDILSGPICLVATIGGKEVVLQKADGQTVKAKPNEVDFISTGAAGGLTAKVLSHVEYDGCTKLTMTLSGQGGKPVQLDGLELRIPVRAERAIYYHWFEATRDPRLTNAGALPAEGLKSHFKPLLWLGDNDRGLCWFAEAPRGWQNNDKESVLRVERQPNAAVMRIRLADRPWTITEPFQTVFGLMATPTRPSPPGWRDWLIPLNQSNPWSSWAPGFNNLSGTDDPGTLYAKDWAAMKQWVADTQKLGPAAPYYPDREPCKVIPYSQVVFWSGKHRDGMPSPEIKLFGPEWSNRDQPPGPRQEPDEQIPLKEYYWVCPNSSFAQFYLYRMNELIDKTNIDGIYIDGSWWFCNNKQHGCGYQDDAGVWQNQYNIWAFRELFKRMYCLFYEKKQNPVLHFHTSCWLAIPSLSFCHMLLDGEQYHDAGQKVEDHFMDIVPLDKWRAEHANHWGPVPFILPDIPGQWAAAQAPTRELLMLTNLHDTAIFPGNFNYRLMMRNYQAKRWFGVARCDFRGYWGDQDWVTCDTPDGHVSVYRQPDGSKALLVVGNSAKQDATLAMKPNLAGLKLKGRVEAAVDLETQERVALVNGVLSVPVKARDYRLLAIPYYEAPALTAGDMAVSAKTEVSNGGFEHGLAGWTTVRVEGNDGSVTEDRGTKFAGQASCHLHKADGPGGVMVQSDDVFKVEAGKRYRVNCQLKIANSTGAQAYWMISAMDREGNNVLSNNLFAGFVKENQDWRPLPYEFDCPPGAAVVRIHFLVAFPGQMDAWIDEVTLEQIK